MYRNHEGYPDPTAGQAFANIRREEKLAMKQAGIRLAYEQKSIKRNNRPPRSVQRAKQRENRKKGGRMV